MKPSTKKQVSSCLLLLALSFETQSVELRTAAQDSAPKYYVDANSGQMKGLCIDILAALSDVDTEITFTGQNRFLPSARIYRSLREGSLDLFCGSGKTPQRQAQLVYLDPALYPVNHQLLARSSDSVQVNSFDDLRRLSDQGLTLTYLNSATHHFLLQQGGLELEEGTSLKNLFERLLLGRGRFIYYHDLGLNHYVKTEKLEQEVRFLSTHFRSYHHYLIASDQISTESLSRVKAALEQLATSGRLAQIYRQYQP